MIPGFLRRQYLWISASLYRKYVLIIGLLVVGALLFSGGLDIFFTYKDKLNSLSDLEREEAEQDVRLNSNLPQFVHTVLSRFGLHFSCGRNKGHQRPRFRSVAGHQRHVPAESGSATNRGLRARARYVDKPVRPSVQFRHRAQAFGGKR